MHKRFVGITVMICMVLSMSPITAYSIETQNNYEYTPNVSNFSLDTANLTETIAIDNKDENKLLKTSLSNINEPNNNKIYMSHMHGTLYQVAYYVLKTISIVGMILGCVGGFLGILSCMKVLPATILGWEVMKLVSVLGGCGLVNLGLDLYVVC